MKRAMKQLHSPSRFSHAQIFNRYVFYIILNILQKVFFAKFFFYVRMYVCDCWYVFDALQEKCEE